MVQDLLLLVGSPPGTHYQLEHPTELCGIVHVTDDNMHAAYVNMHVKDANMHVTDVNMHVTDANMHVTDVNYLIYAMHKSCVHVSTLHGTGTCVPLGHVQTHRNLPRGINRVEEQGWSHHGPAGVPCLVPCLVPLSTQLH
jgi:hypothetical protein